MTNKPLTEGNVRGASKPYEPQQARPTEPPPPPAPTRPASSPTPSSGENQGNR